MTFGECRSGSLRGLKNLQASYVAVTRTMKGDPDGNLFSINQFPQIGLVTVGKPWQHCDPP